MSVHLKSRFSQIEREIPHRADAAVRVGAEIVERAAKDRVPVLTGRLRDAIHVEREGPGRFAVVAGNTEAFYGHIVEHGGVYTPPHPFLVPAFEERRAEVVKAIELGLRNL